MDKGLCYKSSYSSPSKINGKMPSINVFTSFLNTYYLAFQSLGFPNDMFYPFDSVVVDHPGWSNPN